MKKKRYLPFGYQMEKGKIIPHPDEGPLVQAIFQNILKGPPFQHSPNMPPCRAFLIGKEPGNGIKP